ncbi:MAG: sigma-70 family RNA polymerase sigma factor [Clostridiales bacterium]|nr:sigma-70 family RNA polymerase sigma factor [Clostridiales bacterium]
MDLETSKMMRDLYERHYKGMVFTAYCLVRCYDTAEDMVQKSFENFIKSGKSMQELTINEAEALIKTIIINTSLNEIKSKEYKTIKTDQIEEAVQDRMPDIIELIISVEKRSEILRILEDLSLEEKSIFLLRSYYEWSYDEISHAFNIKAATLRKRYERIRKKILKLIGKDESDDNNEEE